MYKFPYDIVGLTCEELQALIDAGQLLERKLASLGLGEMEVNDALGQLMIRYEAARLFEMKNGTPANIAADLLRIYTQKHISKG